MDFSLIYLAHRFVYRIFDFFHRWYGDGSRYFASRTFSFFRSLDQGFALRMTLEHFFEPLYKDYSLIGRILGVIFRSGRIIAGAICYVCFGLIALLFYAVWLLIPAAMLYLSYRNTQIAPLWESFSTAFAHTLLGAGQRLTSALEGIFGQF